MELKLSNFTLTSQDKQRVEASVQLRERYLRPGGEVREGGRRDQVGVGRG